MSFGYRTSPSHVRKGEACVGTPPYYHPDIPRATQKRILLCLRTLSICSCETGHIMLVLYSLSCHSANAHSIICSSTVHRLRKPMSVPPTQAATENIPSSQLPANDGPLTPPRLSGEPLTVKDTPVSHKQAGSYRYTSTCFPSAVDRNVKLAEEVNGYVVGPMPVKTFLEKYVPETEATSPFHFNAEEAKELQDSLGAMTDENQMYPAWIPWMEQYIGKYHLADVHKADIAQLCGRGIRPDVVLHQNSLKDDNNKYQWQNIELIGEFKTSRECDPFVDDDPESMCSDTQYGASTLGQITSYATCHMSMQCRTHVFQFVVVGDYARLLRWDRSGVVVTAKIPLEDKSFAEFFWRFAHLGSKERGWDSTVSKPLKEEVDQAKPALDAAEAKLRKRPDESRSSYAKIFFGESAYIVHRLFYSGLHSPFGRGTRGYAAYSLKDRKVVFLKSTWRVDGSGRIPEHETLKKLHDAGVQHIPTVIESWENTDLQGTHVSQTQDGVQWMKEDTKRKRLRKLRHYILVLNELGRDVTTFKSTKELLTALSDAAEAHEQADDRAKILHRDISPGNILITDEGRGLLIDWDLAKDQSETAHVQGEQQPERTGTYQFMAARFVNRVHHLNSEPHNRLDDIESMFHVLQWIILRYVNHGLSNITLQAYLKLYFDQAEPRAADVPVCIGRQTRIVSDFDWDEFPRLRPLLRDILTEIRRIIATRYVDPGELQQMPVQLGLRNNLDERGWLAATLRRAADDPECPTTDESVPQIILKGTKSEIYPTGPEYRYSSEKHPRKAQKGNDGQRNPTRAAKTKANSNLTEADVGDFTTSVNAMADDDDPDDEGPSTRRKSTNRKRKKNTN